MKIISGKQKTALKVVLYGPEGIGKSSFAARFPNPIFIDTEGSTKHMDVQRFEKPLSWQMLLSQIQYVKQNPNICRTLVIDTADWAEQLCITQICAKAQKNGIEDFGYGKGYIYLAEEFGRLLNLLEDLVDRGVNIVLTAHAKMRKFEQPDEMGAYDRWELKLEKQTAPLLKEWADMVLFANYKTYIVKSDTDKTKAQGGKRVMYTAHHPCWDAKNRHNLPEELSLDYSNIAHLFSENVRESEPPVPEIRSGVVQTQTEKSNIEQQTLVPQPQPPTQAIAQPNIDPTPTETPAIPKALLDLMNADGVSEDELRKCISKRGYYPKTTPVSAYDKAFIEGVLIAAWSQVFGSILEIRKFEQQDDDLPF